MQYIATLLDEVYNFADWRGEVTPRLLAHLSDGSQAIVVEPVVVGDIMTGNEIFFSNGHRKETKSLNANHIVSGTPIGFRDAEIRISDWTANAADTRKDAALRFIKRSSPPGADAVEVLSRLLKSKHLSDLAHVTHYLKVFALHEGLRLSDEEAIAIARGGYLRLHSVA